MRKVCLVGDVVVDVSLKTEREPGKLRLGGIVHSARALWAMNVPFTVGYFAPSYLDDSIVAYLKSLGCTEILKLGDVLGSPSVFLIEELKEVGDQGYSFLMSDQLRINYSEKSIKQLSQKRFNDCLVISGNYDLPRIVGSLKGSLHIDVANNIKSVSALKKCGRKIETIFISTSSDLFRSLFKTNFTSFCKKFADLSESILLKENRGGSRLFSATTKKINYGYSQTRPINHSVGVGDAFDSVFVTYPRHQGIEASLTTSSWIAAEYASTTYPDDFKKEVSRILKSNVHDLIRMRGVSLPWEMRKKIDIYIAAPDFDHVDTRPIDTLVESLHYHNFRPRRPIRENGQLKPNAKRAIKKRYFTMDIDLLERCSILIAVLLYDDPGTYIELGYAVGKNITCMVYDPFRQAKNCMLTEMPSLVTSDLDEIIAEVFVRASELQN